MGNAINSAANSVGSALVNIIAAPFKSIFKGSCTWDFICFIEHLCVNDLARLLMVLFLCYISLLLLYVMFKIGIFKRIGKSLCKMCWAACEAYWCALYRIACFICFRIRNTKRVNRKRRRDFHDFHDSEKGYRSSSSSDIDLMDTYRHRIPSRKRKSFQRENHVKQTRYHYHSHFHSSKSNVSFRVKDRSRRPKPLKIRNLEKGRAKKTSFKRRRL